MVPEQCKMGRAALGLSVAGLASAAGVSTSTIVRFERGDRLQPRTIDAIRDALDRGGFELTNGERPGGRLKGRSV
jgi:transcriptional regulator with XRE-family HTH domain